MRRGYLRWLALLILSCLTVLLAAGDARAGQLALNTLLLAAGTCLVALPLAVMLALVLARLDVYGRRLALVVLLAMLFIPLYLQAAAWNAGFGMQGWYALVTESLDAPLLWGWRGAIWVHAMAALPWATLILVGGLRVVEREFEEAALLDGSLGQTLLYATLPRAVPALGVATLWITVSIAGEMTVTDIFQVRTYAEEVYTGLALGESLGEVSVRLIPGLLLLVALIFSGLITVMTVIPAGGLSGLGPAPLFRLGPKRLPVSVLVWLLLLLIVGVPAVNLFYKSGMEVEQLGGTRLRHWSAAHFADLMLPLGADMQQSVLWRFREELTWTALLGLLTATVASACGALAAWWQYGHHRREVIILMLAAVLLAIPGPLVGLSIIQLLNREQYPLLIWLYDRTIFAPLAALVVRALPWSLLICWAGLRVIPSEQLEMATTQGAGWLARLRYIVVPQQRAVLALAWLVAFAISTGDLAASILVVPPGLWTVPISVFNLIHAGVDDVVAALCLTVTIIYVLAACAAVRLWRV